MIRRYKTKKGWLWAIDEHITLPDGTQKRLKKRPIPTKEQAEAQLAKWRTEVYETGNLQRTTAPRLTVSDLWEQYEEVTKEQKNSWRQDKSYAVHLCRHLGGKRVTELTQMSVDAYRAKRRKEPTRFKAPPSDAQLDREIELLRRFLNYAVKCKVISQNPLAGVQLLDPHNKNNVRSTVVNEEQFSALYANASPLLQPILALAFDTGMRRNEILRLPWEFVNLKDQVIRLPPAYTKENHWRVIYLTDRAAQALKQGPRRLRCPYVFPNPKTGEPITDFRRSFRTACNGAGMACGGKDGLRFHDLRRSFVTKSRRAGIPESVVMMMSGHKTREVFARYNIVEEDDLRRARDRLQAAAGGGA